MPQITPVNNFENLANKMITSVSRNCSDKNFHIKNFYATANKSGQQGNALISYFTAFNKADNISVNKLERTITNNPESKKEVEDFLSALKFNYPRTLSKRISALASGSVVDGKVEPKSRFKKFLIFLDNFVGKE